MNLDLETPRPLPREPERRSPPAVGDSLVLVVSDGFHDHQLDAIKYALEATRPIGFPPALAAPFLSYVSLPSIRTAFWDVARFFSLLKDIPPPRKKRAKRFRVGVMKAKNARKRREREARRWS